jgi:hypothetical protein
MAPKAATAILFDDEFERAVEPLRGAEHDAERDGDDGGDQGGGCRAVDGFQEIEAERSVHAVPERAEGRDRGGQENRIDPLPPRHQRPDHEQTRDPEHRQKRFGFVRVHTRRTSR